MEQDPFISFLSNLTEKIKVEKEHKALMEKINSNTKVPSVLPLEETLINLQEKINQQVQAHLQETIVVNEPTIEVIEEKNFEDFVDKLKDILATPREVTLNRDVVEEEAPLEQEPVKETDPEPNPYIQELQKQSTEKTPESSKYINDLDKLTTKVVTEKQPEKVEDVKKLIEEYVTKYARRILDLGGGGGSVAKQFADGGTMNGSLTVVGDLSSTGTVYDGISNSNVWNNIYIYKSSNFVAVTPSYYMVDTTTQGVTATLSTASQLGLITGFLDPYKTWGTNNFVLSANDLIEGQNQPVSMNMTGILIKAIYVGGNQGWRLTQ